MKRWFPKWIGGVLVAFSTLALAAAEPSPKPDDGRKLAAEQGEAVAKDGRKTNANPSREERDKRREEFNKLSPEEREAKRKEIKGRLEKRICELRSKQTNATLSSQEVRELERREQILKRFDQPFALDPAVLPVK